MLDQTREDTIAYYAHQSFSQASPSLAGLEEAPPKPEALVLFEDLLALHTTFLAGGYVDQPWLVMQLMTAAAQGKALFITSYQQTTPSE